MGIGISIPHLGVLSRTRLLQPHLTQLHLKADDGILCPALRSGKRFLGAFVGFELLPLSHVKPMAGIFVRYAQRITESQNFGVKTHQFPFCQCLSNLIRLEQGK